jgi:hypothetical protein
MAPAERTCTNARIWRWHHRFRLMVRGRMNAKSPAVLRVLLLRQCAISATRTLAMCSLTSAISSQMSGNTSTRSAWFVEPFYQPAASSATSAHIYKHCPRNPCSGSFACRAALAIRTEASPLAVMTNTDAPAINALAPMLAVLKNATAPILTKLFLHAVLAHAARRGHLLSSDQRRYSGFGATAAYFFDGCCGWPPVVARS